MIELNSCRRELKMRQNAALVPVFSLFFSFYQFLIFVVDQNAKINRPFWELRSKSRNATNFDSERLKNLRRYGTY